VQFPNGTPPVVQVAAGADASLALTSDGNVWGWGVNGVGELGDGTNADWRSTPVQAHLGAYAGQCVACEADGYSSLALTADGHVLAWGSGAGGALGDGSTADADVSTAVNLGTKRVSALAAGGTQAGHVVALTTTGGLIAWGNNAQGQVGDGSTTDRHAPVTVSGGLTNVIDVGAGSYQSFALTGAGAAYAWGDNGYGELGDGQSSTIAKTPVAVAPPIGKSTLPPIAALTGGDFYSLALPRVGNPFSTGLNDTGQLGTGQEGDSVGLARVALPATTTIASLSATKAFGLAIVGKPAASVVQLSPRSGPSGTQVLIAGHGFKRSSTVLFGSKAATSVTFVSARELIATAPSGSGAVSVKVDSSPAAPGAHFTYG
jgi:alpha-tubulin suppressor-like RCC1 family protein